MFSFLFDKYQGVGLLNYMANLYGKFRMANLYGNLEDTTILFYNLHSHQQSIMVPVAPHPHQNLVLLVFNFCHSSGYVVVSHCGFNMHFPDK